MTLEYYENILVEYFVLPRVIVTWGIVKTSKPQISKHQIYKHQNEKPQIETPQDEKPRIK